MNVEMNNKSDKVVVRLTHFSIKKYLIFERILQEDVKQYNILKINANIAIYNDCLAYLLEFKELNCLTS